MSRIYSVGVVARENAHAVEKERLQKDLEEDPHLTLHMDGKKYDEEGVFKERVPMCVSGFANGGDHLLEIPLVNDGKAKTLAKKVIFFPSIYLFIYLLKDCIFIIF